MTNATNGTRATAAASAPTADCGRTRLADLVARNATNTLYVPGQREPRKCALCDDYEHEHTPRFIDAAQRCQVTVQLQPPTLLLPEGATERCDCPGFERDEDDDQEAS